MAKFNQQEKTLWCGNFTSEVTRDILYELFLQAGPLESVVIPKDKDGKQRNYAFVMFKHEVSVPYAIDLLNGTLLFGSPLRVKSRSSSMDNSQSNRNGNDNFNDKNDTRRVNLKRSMSKDHSDDNQFHNSHKRHKGETDRQNSGIYYPSTVQSWQKSSHMPDFNKHLPHAQPLMDPISFLRHAQHSINMSNFFMRHYPHVRAKKYQRRQ